MGQCSALPAEGRHHHPVASSRTDREQRSRLREDRKETMDFNRLVTEKPKKRSTPRREVTRSSPQTREPGQMSMEMDDMDVDIRDAPQIPPPPENALKSRCYKLNLDSEINLSSLQRSQMYLGPFTHPTPCLTYSESTDSGSIDEVQIAIKTANIFRGITVGKDGTILTQNARASRSSRGKNKKGEKSRQAVKIEKAQDLVEESMATGKAPGTDEPAKLISLYVMGEYDDMKYLVRDGSKKLREADDLADDVLFGINRSRSGRKVPVIQELKTPLKDTLIENNSMAIAPRSNNTNSSSTLKQTLVLPQKSTAEAATTTTPRLKSHPRDTRSRLGDCRNEWSLMICGQPNLSSPRHYEDDRQERNTGRVG